MPEKILDVMLLWFRKDPPPCASGTLSDVGQCHQRADDVIREKALKGCIRDFRGLAGDKKAAEVNTLWSRRRATSLLG